MLKSQENFIIYLRQVQQLLSYHNEFRSDQSLLDRVVETELVVPVIGAFSAGKSTLLNTLIDQNLLPVGIAPETELATELRYSKESYLLAIKHNGEQEKLPVEAINEVNKRSSEFTHLRLYIDSEALKILSPLVLVDMPGFGSSLESHNKAIAFYLPRGVHFVVVTSVEDGTITASMLRKLDEIKSYNADFTFVLSRCNQKASKDVEEVHAFIKDQLSVYFNDRIEIISVGQEDGKKLTTKIGRLQSDDIFYHQFIDKLKEDNLDLLSQINLSISVLKNSKGEGEKALLALGNALEKLLDQQHDAESEIKNRYSGRAVDQCLKDVERQLNSSLAELVSLGKSRNQQGMTAAISEIVRVSMVSTIKAEIKDISMDMVDSLTTDLANTNTIMSGLNIDSNWCNEMAVKVKRSLELATETLSDWGSRLIEKENKENKENKQKEKVEKVAKAGYRTLSTVAAVATSVVNPVIELTIIFLPEILNYFASMGEEKKIKEKLVYEVFPGIKSNLRENLPHLINEQLEMMLQKVSESFEEQIGKQREIITINTEKTNQASEEIQQRIASLELLSSHLKTLASQHLYRQ